jgi:hypothetical protein
MLRRCLTAGLVILLFSCTVGDEVKPDFVIREGCEGRR